MPSQTSHNFLVALAGTFSSLRGRGIYSRIISGEGVAHGQALQETIRRTDKQSRGGFGTATEDRCCRSTGRSRCSQRPRSRVHCATEAVTVCNSLCANLCRIAEPEKGSRTCRVSSVWVDVNRSG